MSLRFTFLGRVALVMLSCLGAADPLLPVSWHLAPAALAQQVPGQQEFSSPSAPSAFPGSATPLSLQSPAAAASPVDPAALVTPTAPGGTSASTVSDPAAATPADAGLTPLPSLTTATPVVLELFTAEGCVSCLPADANIGPWANRRSVLVLTYHVDYWDYIGWRDGKAEPAFAERQQKYMAALGRNMVYTPQLIIGGSEESLGTDRDRLVMSLADNRHVTGMIPLRWLRDLQGHVFVDLPAATLDQPATLWLITFRRSVETDILTGETAGRHVVSVNVVRSVQKLGDWSGAASRVPVAIDQKAGGALPADAMAIVANRAGFGPVIAATAIADDSLK